MSFTHARPYSVTVNSLVFQYRLEHQDFQLLGRFFWRQDDNITVVFRFISVSIGMEELDEEVVELARRDLR